MNGTQVSCKKRVHTLTKVENSGFSLDTAISSQGKKRVDRAGKVIRATVIGHFLIEPIKHAWIVWKGSVIESTSHETWNKLCKQP